jgi:signal transduction histidine kinase
MVERDPTGADLAEVGRHIREECETLETVVRRFMDFVRRETLNLASLDVGRLLSRVVAREFRSRPGVTVSLVGDSVSSLLVGDEELLERGLENLVRNAADAAGTGGHVWVEVAAIPEALVVTISDDGPGMSEERRREIRPFFTSKAGGLGLGLPIALKIVRLHGGDLLLAERAPRGLTVTVTLPLKAAPA